MIHKNFIAGDRLNSCRTIVTINPSEANNVIGEYIIARDEDIDDTNLDIAVKAAYFSTGQECTDSIGLIVQSGIDSQFFDKVVESLKTPHIGHVFDPMNPISPIVSQHQPNHDLKSANPCNHEERYPLYGGVHFKGQPSAGMVSVHFPTADVNYHAPLGSRRGSSYGNTKTRYLYM